LAGLGRSLGNIIEPGVGGVIGASAGDILGNLFGWGDYETAPVNYHVNSNTTVGFVTPEAAQIPMMHTEDGVCRIRKREFVQDVYMSTVFTSTYFALNPSDTTTFPWLSQVAKNFEQFKFLGLSFGFRSTTANAIAAGSPAMGTVMLCTQYDEFDAPISTKVAANNALFSVSCKPSESMLHPVECDPEQTPSQPLYTGVNEMLVARDSRLNYMGFTSLSAVGGSALYVCGELWVTYDVMLYKPMIYTGQVLPINGKSILDKCNEHKEEMTRSRPQGDTSGPPPRSG